MMELYEMDLVCFDNSVVDIFIFNPLNAIVNELDGRVVVRVGYVI